jgi:hypothetical protein
MSPLAREALHPHVVRRQLGKAERPHLASRHNGKYTLYHASLGEWTSNGRLYCQMNRSPFG